MTWCAWPVPTREHNFHYRSGPLNERKKESADRNRDSVIFAVRFSRRGYRPNHRRIARGENDDVQAFPSKSRLVIEVLNEQGAAFAAGIAAAVAAHTDALDKLQAIFQWHDAWFRSETFTGNVLIHAAAEFHAQENEILSASKAQRDAFVDSLRRILGERFDRDTAERLARRCALLLDGATLARQLSGRVDAARDAWHIAQALIETERAHVA